MIGSLGSPAAVTTAAPNIGYYTIQKQSINHGAFVWHGNPMEIAIHVGGLTGARYAEVKEQIKRGLDNTPRFCIVFITRPQSYGTAADFSENIRARPVSRLC